MAKNSKTATLKRLNRIEGQVRGLARMVEDERYCIDIVTQIGAVRAALRRVEEEILRDHVAHCVDARDRERRQGRSAAQGRRADGRDGPGGAVMTLSSRREVARASRHLSTRERSMRYGHWRRSSSRLAPLAARDDGVNVSRISPAPASRRRRALSVWLRRCRAASAPCRNWCRRRCAPSARTSSPRRSRCATCSGVSTVSVATSMTPTSTSLPSSSDNSFNGTRELMHSSDTWLMRLLASAGKIFSYCRHSPPSEFFQSILALMP